MEIKASDVKTLREKTGAGMMDCKKALQEAGGDPAKAEKILKELGLAAAVKRAGRAMGEGRIFSRVTSSKGGLLEISCETDFVARNKDFVATGETVAARFLEKNLDTADAEIEDLILKTRTTIKENIELKRFKKMNAAENEMITDYIHGEGRIGVLVKLQSDKKEALSDPAVKEFAFNTALHIAAFAPAFLSKEKVDAGYLKEQEEIFAKQAENLGKPANVLAGIAKGKLAKHLSEICLVEQPFVKDDKRSVSQVMTDIGKAIGARLTITDYMYFKVGEEL